jgi:hypothetical protein
MDNRKQLHCAPNRGQRVLARPPLTALLLNVTLSGSGNYCHLARTIAANVSGLNKHLGFSLRKNSREHWACIGTVVRDSSMKPNTIHLQSHFNLKTSAQQKFTTISVIYS